MVDLGLNPFVGLPENPNLDELRTLWSRSGHHKMNAITLISSLLKTPDEAAALHNRLKLSAFERDLAQFIVQHRGTIIGANPLLEYKKLLMRSKSKQSDTKNWILELMKYENFPEIEEFSKWIPPKFPVSGSMLKGVGVESGKFMGFVVNELKEIWLESEFNLSAEELLQSVPKVVADLKERRKK